MLDLFVLLLWISELLVNADVLLQPGSYISLPYKNAETNEKVFQTHHFNNEEKLYITWQSSRFFSAFLAAVTAAKGCSKQ